MAGMTPRMALSDTLMPDAPFFQWSSPATGIQALWLWMVCDRFKNKGQSNCLLLLLLLLRKAGWQLQSKSPS